MALTRPRYSQIYDTDYKQSVRAATTGPVGNLLATGNMTNTVDGVTLAINDRILVKDQADAKQNGIYFVLTLGTGANGTWRRSLDADGGSVGKVTSGLTTTVTEGNDNASKTFKLSTPDPIIVGTTELTFVNPFVITATAGGGNTQIQFNDTGGVLNGSAGLTFNKNGNVLTSTGNVVSTSGYFLGNGALLTGITVDATKIESGNSNVRAYSSSDIAVSVGGTANIARFTTDGITMRTGSEIRGHNVRATNGLLTNTINATSGSNISLSSIYNFNNVNNIWSSNVYATNAVSIGGNLTVAGNLTVTGNLVYLNVDNIVTQDALIYVANGNQFDFLDIGIVGNYTKNSFNQHGGIVRDASDSIWKFFTNVEVAPTTTVDFGSATYDSILAGNVLSTGNVVVGANITLNRRLYAGGSSGDAGQYLSSTGTGVGWSTFDFSTVTNGTDTVEASGEGYVNVSVAGNLITSFTDDGTTFSGNISTAGYFLGNAALLTGLPSSYGNTEVASYLPIYSGVLGSSNLQVTGGGTFSGTLTVGAGLRITSGTTSTSTTTGALIVTGGVGIGGNLFVGGALTESSSATLKENITPIDGALDLILQLTGVIYDRQDGSRKNEAGLIAEEVNKVLPNLITLDDQGTPMGVQYTKLTAYLIEAVKSLKAEIDQLKKRD